VGEEPSQAYSPAGKQTPPHPAACRCTHADVSDRLRVRHAGFKRRPPIVHPSQQWSNLYQSIINPFHMRRRTAPWVQFRLLDQSSPDRVEFHIPGCRQKIAFVHHKRGKPPLPQLTPPTLPGRLIQGTSYLFFLPLPSRLEWVKNPPKHTLQPSGDNCRRRARQRRVHSSDRSKAGRFRLPRPPPPVCRRSWIGHSRRKSGTVPSCFMRSRRWCANQIEGIKWLFVFASFGHVHSLG
jgi:hypothetical protein